MQRVIRELPAPLTIPWRHVAVAVYVAANLSLTLVLVRPMIGPDWSLFAALGPALERGDLYHPDHFMPYNYSPVIAPLFAFLPTLGWLPWAVLHVAALFLWRDRLLILLALTSWAFWTDVGVGNAFTFVVVAGALAYRGNRWATLASFALLFLMPRPIQIPLAVWLWRRQPDVRWPVVGLFGVHAAAVLVTGYADDWLDVLFVWSTQYDIGPTAWIGRAWFLIGLPLAALLTWKGRVGWAGMALTPYTLPQYLLWPLIDLPRRLRSEPAASESIRPMARPSPRPRPG